jgi:predicted transposase/invertase (TIGR01784 family)
MPNFTKTEAELETTFDKWMFVLKHLPDLERRPQVLQERVFDKLFSVAEIAKFTPEERQGYEQSLKYYRDLKNVIDTSYMEGLEEGKVEGKIEGKIEGMQERNLEIARQMKADGEPVDKIQRYTGLTEEEIAGL